MTDMKLTRRNILAGMGAVGAAGAAAGFGTSALFNDTESLVNNEVVAGELDLKVDWEEHYSFPQIYGFDDPTADLDVTRSTPDDTTSYVGLPDPENPVVWANSEDGDETTPSSLDAYMSNTAIEAFPDPNDDGEQEVEIGEFTYAPCDQGADLPDDLGTFAPGEEVAARTQNDDTTDDDGVPEPLINLTDVKPGDFGEFTFSFHLCDNPGYVWLQAANVDEDGGANPEPEQEVEEDDDNDANLAENIETVWWYDDGNNVIDAELIGKADVMICVDTSGSLDPGEADTLADAAETLASDLTSQGDVKVGGLSFGDNSIDNFSGLGPSLSFPPLPENGGTPFPPAIEIAAAELDAEGRPGAETFIIVFTDGGPNYGNKEYNAGGYTVGTAGGDGDGEYTGGNFPNPVVNDSELCETAQIAEVIRSRHRILTVGIDDEKNPTNNSDPQDCDGNDIDSLEQYLQDYIAGSEDDYVGAESPAAVSTILNEVISAIEMREEVFRRGTLADDLDALSTSPLPLDGDLSTDFEELGDPANSEARECFQPGVPNYIGFAWWLPEDVGNEVQGDSVSFDLGFYTEQCRNNDGTGAFGNS